MIKLPKFSSQSLYDSETDFNLQMTRERMSKFLIHHECFKKITISFLIINNINIYND